MLGSRKNSIISEDVGPTPLGRKMKSKMNLVAGGETS